MTKFWDPDTELLTRLKNSAFKAGKKADKNAMFLLRSFYNKNDLEHMLYAGKTMARSAIVISRLRSFVRSAPASASMS